LPSTSVPKPSLRDQREAIAPVVAVARPQPNPPAVALDHQAVAVVFNLVKPVRPIGTLVPRVGMHGENADLGGAELCPATVDGNHSRYATAASDHDPLISCTWLSRCLDQDMILLDFTNLTRRPDPHRPIAGGSTAPISAPAGSPRRSACRTRTTIRIGPLASIPARVPARSRAALLRPSRKPRLSIGVQIWLWRSFGAAPFYSAPISLA
jgi:hypothetical protein